MPGSKKSKPGILEEVQEAATEAFISTAINEAGGLLIDIAVSTIPGANLIKSPIVAAFGAASYSIRNGTKRKIESDSTKEIEYGVREHSDDFQYVYNNDEIVSKRPCVVDNYVSREEREKELDKLFGIPELVTNFVKREELEELSENFKKNCSIQVVTSRVSIVGLGGIGKTQLAAKFVERNKGEYKDNFWIDAERYCINDSFNRLAKEIGISPQANATCLARDVYKKLNNQKTLIIFDNVDDYDSVKDFLPHQDYNTIHVLITSRYNKWENTGVRPVELGVFTFKESKEFIKKELKTDDNDQVKKLHEKLQGLPLALQQAVAYIKHQRNVKPNFGIEDYLKEYDKRAEELLSYDLHEKNNDPYMKTVMTTWKVTLDKIANDMEYGKEAIRILNVMAYLAPDNISNVIFSKLSNIDTSKTASAINLLKNYSMINQGSKSDLSNIHRLVQEVIRIDLKNAKESKEETVLSDAFDILNKRYNTRSSSQLSINDKDYKTMSAVLVCIHAIQYPKFQEQIKDFFSFLNTTLHKNDKENSYLLAAQEFLYYAINFDNKELVNFILGNVESYYSNHEEDLFSKWKADQSKIISACTNMEMMKFLEKLSFNLKITDKNSAITNPNCKIALEFLMQCNKVSEPEDSEWLEQAILNTRVDVVKLLLKKQPDLALKKVTRIYCRSGRLFGCCGQNYSSILEFAKECCKKIEEGNEIIDLIKSSLNNSNSTRYPGSDIEDEMESDTESLLSVGGEDSDLEEFTPKELKDAKFSNSPSSNMEVDNIQSSSGTLKSWLPPFFR